MEDSERYYKLAISYRLKGDYNKAIEYSYKAAAIRPDDPDIYYHLGFIYEVKGDYDKAIECLQKVIRIAPSDIDAYDAYGCLGSIYKRQGKYPKAMACFRKATIIKTEKLKLDTDFETTGNEEKAKCSNGQRTHSSNPQQTPSP